jgi:hypothetical protein
MGLQHVKSISTNVQYVTLPKYFSHSSFSYELFPTPPIQLELGLLAHGRLVIAAHLDQSNYLANQKQGEVIKYDLTVFITLFHGSSRAMKAMVFFKVPPGVQGTEFD